MADLKTMKGVSAKDRKLIEEAETLIGPEPDSMGLVKNMFWGNLREDLIFPFPEIDPEETARCDQLIAELDEYLHNEHPSALIDQEQEIPEWVIRRLFEIGVLGMTIPKEYGGRGLGITSYNRVLERIGSRCGSTAVMVSAHQSIGCKAIMLFGTEKQKQDWLPHLANDWLSAFCLSEPNVGCDAGGPETRCELSEDGEYYILNGEKKWATSGALSGLFTVMGMQKMPNGKDRVTAVVCTPDMDGIEIIQKNRSKCGIRGTWQARIRFTNARVPKANLLHEEGRGLHVALTCLNFGRCTLSAGMLGGARYAMDQAAKWARTRHQFKRALSDFELVQLRLARMAAYCYASDAVLYATTGFLDRNDEDIMVETAICKVFCSEMGWRVVNDAMQIMGGEGYMTENEVERIFRDSRINLIVEGANEVMQSFIFAYGAKQLAEQMLGVQNAVGWESDEGFVGNLTRIAGNMLKPRIAMAAAPLAIELYLGVRRKSPVLNRTHSSLAPQSKRLCKLIREHSHHFKQASRLYKEKILEYQTVQARLADNAVLLHAYACTLAKLDRDIRAGSDGIEFERDRAAAIFFFSFVEEEFNQNIRGLYENTDDLMRGAAAAQIKVTDALPNSDFIVPERSPVAMGEGRSPVSEGIKQFPGDAHAHTSSGT
jgi:acyl-CoA dehydrogenase family member 9